MAQSMATKKKTAAATEQHTEEAAKKPKTKRVRYVVLKDGSRHLLTGQDGKYLYCEGTTIRHTNPQFDRIEAETVEIGEGK